MLVYLSQKRESMYIQNVPKVGISSVVHSKHIDSGNIDVVDNDIRSSIRRALYRCIMDRLNWRC